MSVYLRITEQDGREVTFRMRSLDVTVGLRSDGNLTTGTPCDPLFSIAALPEGALLALLVEGFFFDGTPVSRGEYISLCTGNRLCGAGREFLIFITSPLAESLSEFSSKVILEYEKVIIADNQPFRRISAVVRLCGRERRFPLLPFLDYTIGSHPSANIVLDFPEIASRHLSIRCTKRAATISPLTGRTIAYGKEIAVPISIEGTATVRLFPLELPLEIHFER